MLKKLTYVGAIVFVVAGTSVVTLQHRFPVGPILIGLGIFVWFALIVAGRKFKDAVPDFVFGSIDTGLLTIPALWGGALFGVAGAIAGGVVGDALTDAIAGFFEGSIAQWLGRMGFESEREAVTTSLGKMSGCLLGAGVVLSVAFLFGVNPRFD